MLKRSFNLDTALERKSIFLFGPRQTGKSTYLNQNFPHAFSINLLKSAEFRELLSNPEKLSQKIHAWIDSKPKNSKQIIIIDEIQKIPILLDEVHALIEENKNLRFILTGSSPRKLKRMQANMLGGRAALQRVHPITSHELKTDPKIKKNYRDILLLGALPFVFYSKAPFDDLEDYISTYLKEEIEEEGLSRSIGQFSRFLNFAALNHGQQLNFTSLGSDAQISPTAVKEYFQILHDTLVGTLVEPFTLTKKRKAMMSAKFFFFDLGLLNAIVKRRSLVENSPEWGVLLESFIFNEIQAYLHYQQIQKTIQFWRSTSKLEVDFLIWDEHNQKDLLAVEVKSTANPLNKHCKGMNALSEEFPQVKKIIVCTCNSPMMLDHQVLALPVEVFLERLWRGEIITNLKHLPIPKL